MRYIIPKVYVVLFMKQIDCVRELAEDWSSVVQTVADKYTDVKSTLVDILNCFPLNDDEFHKGHVTCFCAFSTDLCILMLNRKQDVDVNSVKQCLVELLTGKNSNVCFDFINCVSMYWHFFQT